ncbi:MAG: SpoIIE family protein phosphatase [Richelia sp. RM2_1_2]|nr:SpoIIE family protein phosphatase [Richelia sp. SM1_7_0]NJN09637.1 SpoIIE family protein phosphatase [Richelia sp. RM1_1_1]NJO27948.1 SpoIIE family protein phosphatase [Richelia sp. SL_2_1]NJO57255.1 SpoIIE family protein phosphatase [Richelia sp. RM2_1_2]
MSQSIKPFYLNIFSAKKYRTILLSAVLFLTFDLGVLLPNFLISSNLKKDAVSINLAGRQRMLSQKITKALLQVKVAQLAQRDTGKAKQELEKSFQLFDDTLLGFDRGKIVTGGDDKPVFLDGVTTTQAKEIIAQAQTIWLPYKTKIQSVLASSDNSLTASLEDAIVYTEGNNLKLLDLMNQLTTEQQQRADNKANTLQIIQTTGLIFALINFFILLSHSLRKFKDHDIQIQLASAEIEALNEKLEQDNLRMKQELDVTRQVQQMILPRAKELAEIPDLDIAGFMQTASEVGGDYYDVIHHDGKVKIGIGDVTGHGLESGMLMLMVQTAVRTLLINNQTDPKIFLDVLNRTIYQNIQRMELDKNMTLSILDYEDGKMRISGQHEEILVVRRGGMVQRLDTVDLGLPIGMEEDIAEFIGYADVHLYPGDMVVLYTDGITEAENSNKEQYGLKQLMNVIKDNWDKTAEEVKLAIIQDLSVFAGDSKPLDDITLVVLKRKIAPAKELSVAS